MIREEEINKIIKEEKLDTNLISDGYHTFSELYEHRIALFIAFCNVIDRVDYAECAIEGPEFWKSKKHYDGSSWDGWFIAGMNWKGTQISYHLPIQYWDKLEISELEKAPYWDGHTPADVIRRLLTL